MNIFTCPYCRGQLNVNGFLVIAAQTESGDRGVLLLSEKVGDFTIHLSANLQREIKEGDKLHFHCPTCQETLEYAKNRNLARLFLSEDGGLEHTIVFSTIFGEQSTYQISEERTKSFGEHALRYMDPEWYKKS